MPSYRLFVEDKQNFLKNIAQNDLQYEQASDKLNATEALLHQKDYLFLSFNSKLIEQEFDHLFKTLKKRAGHSDRKEEQAFWLYCYYCSKLLEAYFKAYGKLKEAEEYSLLAQLIEERYTSGQFSPAPRLAYEPFLNQVARKIRETLTGFCNSVQHISIIRNKAALTNIYRIYWVFCRLTVKQSLLLMKGSNWLKQFDLLLNQHTKIDAFISNIEAPNFILKYASIGLFATRFIIHAGMLTKHVFFPNEQERLLSKRQRFYQEFNKRHADFLNDLLWGTVNGLTNFSATSAINPLLANWMIACFMSFDACLLLYRRRQACLDYQLKKKQYEHELDTTEDRELIALTEEQLDLLNINWQATSATYYFNVSAALLMMSGFTASLLLTQASLILLSYFACTVAVSMYLTNNEFFNYQEKKLLSHAAPEDLDRQLESSQAQSEFFKAVSKQCLLPISALVLCALTWEAVLLLTVLVLTYKVYQAMPEQEVLEPELLLNPA